MRIIRRYLVMLLVPLGILLWRAGFFASDTMSFPLPASAVQERLGHTGLPPLVFGERPPAVSVRSEPGRVSWLISEDGSEMMRYVADIRPVDAGHSRVHVALEGPSNGRFGDVDARINGDRSLRNLYVTAMKEQVHAVLEHRPFHYSAVNTATVVAVGMHLHQISGWMDRAGDAQDAVGRKNMDEAYRDAGLD